MIAMNAVGRAKAAASDLIVELALFCARSHRCS